MTGAEVRPVCEAMGPQTAHERRCAQGGVLERPRTLPWGLVVRARGISAGPPGGASQAAGRRSALACAVPPVGRSAFSCWVAEPRARCLAALAARSLPAARAQQGERSGPRWGVPAWSLVEATPVRGRAPRRQACPGTGDEAARQGPKVRSVGGGAPVRDPCRPARAPDRRPRALQESWRG